MRQGAWGNGAGRLQTRADDSGSTFFAYGALGETNMTWRTLRPVGGQTNWTWVTTSFAYDSFGRQRSVTYNDWETVEYHYDRGGNLQRVTGTPDGGSPRDYLAFVGYDQYGQRSRVMLGNGTETRYQRDPLMQRLREVNTDGPGATPIQRLFYGYNDAGNIKQRNQLLPSVMGGGFGGESEQSFEYDDLGQLTSASAMYRESSTHERRYTLAMQYDAIGNITNKTQNDVRSLVGGASPATLAGTSHALGYTYLGAGSVRPHAATQVGTRTFAFDLNGNQLGWTDSATSSVRQLVWDEDDRLASVTTNGSTVEFLYDGAGERTHKWSKDGVSVYGNAYWSVRNGVQTTKHIFASGQRIASIVTDPTTGTQEHWLHTDHLGSTQFVTDAAGNVREHHESFPFGEPWIEESSTSDTTPFRFTGKEQDSETGLQYFGARYYDPRQGQWASVDPELRGFWASTPQSDQLWTSAYANNSPVRLFDPNGRWVSAEVPVTINGHPATVQTRTGSDYQGVLCPDCSRGGGEPLQIYVSNGFSEGVGFFHLVTSHLSVEWDGGRASAAGRTAETNYGDSLVIGREQVDITATEDRGRGVLYQTMARRGSDVYLIDGARTGAFEPTRFVRDLRVSGVIPAPWQNRGIQAHGRQHFRSYLVTGDGFDARFHAEIEYDIVQHGRYSGGGVQMGQASIDPSSYRVSTNISPGVRSAYLRAYYGTNQTPLRILDWDGRPTNTIADGQP
jgi:RHS repeat-associated protein